MQMLTGREVLRTHYPWQLMTKHPMWIALQHRREMQGFDERVEPGDVLVNEVEAAISEADSDSKGETDEAEGEEQQAAVHDSDGSSEASARSCVRPTGAHAPEVVRQAVHSSQQAETPFHDVGISGVDDLGWRGMSDVHTGATGAALERGESCKFPKIECRVYKVGIKR